MVEKMSDAELMQSIRTKWGAAIDAACSASSVPPDFLAALIGNEDGAHGGDPAAKRFEKGVLAALWEVLLGRKPSYQGIPRASLVQFVSGVALPPVTAPTSLAPDALQRIDGLATSWGLTQIMGWHIFDLGTTIDELKTPAGNLKAATKLLAQFITRYQLDVRNETELGELFDAWNTGRPDGATFDPNYVTNGLARAAIYRTLEAAA
jgi:hypothetical protein